MFKKIAKWVIVKKFTDWRAERKARKALDSDHRF